jgi:hypothetical protein
VIGSGLPVVDDQSLELLHVAGHMGAALQVTFFNTNLFLKLKHRLHVHVTAFVRGTRQGKLARCEPKMLSSSPLHERQRLERFGAGA